MVVGLRRVMCTMLRKGRKMARVLVFSGAGPYADPWHPFAETSGAVAELLRGRGHDVVVRDSEPGSLLDLRHFDLLVINSGGRTAELDAAGTASWAADHQAVDAFHRSGAPILGLHTAVGTFPDWPGWAAIIGGAWVEDTFHPAMDTATFRPAEGAAGHRVWEGLASVTVLDERYSNLEVSTGSVRLVRHDTHGVQPVMGWAVGGSVIYDGLGHDGHSYESEGRRRLLHNEVDWLLSQTVGAA